MGIMAAYGWLLANSMAACGCLWLPLAANALAGRGWPWLAVAGRG